MLSAKPLPRRLAFPSPPTCADTQHPAAFEPTENIDRPYTSPQVQIPAPIETWPNVQQKPLTEIGHVSTAQISTYSSLDGALVKTKRRKLTPLGSPFRVQVQATGCSSISKPQPQDLTPFDETRHASSFSSLFGALQ